MKPRKKVLYLITKSNWGGAQRYVYDLVTHLDPKLYESVVALGGDGDLSTLLKHARVRVIRINSLDRDISIKKEWGFAKELWAIVRAERPDILHVNSSKAGGIGTLIGRLARVPRVIFTTHGWAFNEDRPFWQKIIIKLLHWVTVILSHKTIAVSRALVTEMNWPGVKNKIKIIHPGRTIGMMYEKEEARLKISEICTDLSQYLNDPWIITIAELHPIKRIAVLFEAIKEVSSTHKNIRAVVIGDGQEYIALQEYIKNNHLESHLFLVGSMAEAARFIKAGDLFILPSKSESYGYVLHEAGLAGIPVVATNVGGIPEVVIHNTTGHLVPPDDSTAIAREIEDFIKHPEILTKLASKHHTAMKDRSVDHMTTATVAVYRVPFNEDKKDFKN